MRLGHPCVTLRGGRCAAKKTKTNAVPIWTILAQHPSSARFPHSFIYQCSPLSLGPPARGPLPPVGGRPRPVHANGPRPTRPPPNELFDPSPLCQCLIGRRRFLLGRRYGRGKREGNHRITQ